MRELLRVVDEHGNFTGEILDREEIHDRNLLHNEVAIFIINDKGQMLLQKRSAYKRREPEKWSLLGGHVGVDENPEENALREIKEEIGIEVSEENLHVFSEKETFIGSVYSEIIYFFYVQLNLPENSFVIQTDELSELKWIYFDELTEEIKKDSFSDISREIIERKFKDLEKLCVKKEKENG